MRLIVGLYVVAQLFGASLACAAQSVGTTQSAPANLSQAELEKLVQPIALYPDLLLQQVLAAATFPEQILDAAMYNEQGKDPQGIKSQPWDDSVKGVANYPSILVKLASDLDWTLRLGSAFINQNEDLRRAIQTMRARAKAVGNLKESDQQHVISETGANNTTIIRIESADPQVVYVPASTATVYEKPVDTSSWLVPLASFGVGMAMGYAIGDDDDNHYYYGGGFYGPGFWYGGPAVDTWVDYRRDRWDDAYDFANDRQDWHQDNRDDWREYRQDLGRKQAEWRDARATRGATLNPEKRAEAQTRLTNARTSRASGSVDQRQAALQSRSVARDVSASNFDRAAATERLNAARASGSLAERAQSFDRERLSSGANPPGGNPAARERAQVGAASFAQQRGGTAFSSGGALSGMNRSYGSVSRASARGMASRASSVGGRRR